MDEVTQEDRESIVASAISTGAYLGWRRYSSFITISDARQEAAEWVLTHGKQVDSLLEDGLRGRRRLQNRIIAHVQRAGRAEKAAKSGYGPEDEAFYTTGTIELVLPALWDEHYRPWTPQDPVGRVKTSGRTYLEWETMVADVRRAWYDADLDPEERLAMAMRYGDHLILVQIARAMEVSEGTVRNRIRSGLRAMQQILGGPAPRSCPNGCQDCAHIGTRRVMSNAEARAVTANAYDE